ncbi:MAG: serine/threonine protein kinase [Planctomycetaceae bacterium]|nr:serine/threonine protein kinase [Planctomycetaceae bacterium]
MPEEQCGQSPEGLLEGVQIEKYLIVSHLNTGGQGTVYLAYDKELDRNVAIKIAHRHLQGNSSLRSRLRHEGMMLARVSHPRLARIYGYGVFQDRPYLVMEYVPGKTLSAIVKERPLASQEVQRMIREIASGLEAVHAESILHLDLKPENVIVTPSGHCKLIDFGMAWISTQNWGVGLQLIAGTWEWMSPEQRRGRIEEWSPATDIFGLGCLLNFLLRGVETLPADSMPDEECQTQLAEMQGQLRRSASNRRLCRIAAKAISYSPDDRQPNVRTFLSELSHQKVRQRWGTASIFVGTLLVIAGLFLQFLPKASAPAHESVSHRIVIENRPDESPTKNLQFEVRTVDFSVAPFLFVWSQNLGLREVRGMTPYPREGEVEWQLPDLRLLPGQELGSLYAVAVGLGKRPSESDTDRLLLAIENMAARVPSDVQCVHIRVSSEAGRIQFRLNEFGKLDTETSRELGLLFDQLPDLSEFHILFFRLSDRDQGSDPITVCLEMES